MAKTKRVPRVTKVMRANKSKKFSKVPSPFGIAEMWNAALSKVEKREVKPRDYLWATDQSKSFVDVFLQLKGEKPSNPPNARSKRKFEAGDVFEWIVQLLLMRAGILKASNVRCEYQYKGLLKTTGKIDHIAGGKPDLKAIKDSLEDMDVPDVFKRGALKIVAHIKAQYPNGLPNMPFEVKSISSFLADGMERSEKPLNHHVAQLFHYLKSARYEKGMIIYICRDDLRMFEFCVTLKDKDVEKEYKAFIKTITEYWKKDEQPPIEEPIIFNADVGRFSKNFKVEYSQYLNKIYGFKEPRKYSEFVSPTVGKWNRVLARVKAGAKMTDKNIEAIAEITSYGLNFKKIIKQFNTSEEE